MDRRARREPGHVFVCEQVVEAPAEPARDDDRPTGEQGREGRGDEPVDVEQRHRQARDVVRVEAVVLDHRACRGDQVALQERHLLRAARRPARGARSRRRQRRPSWVWRLSCRVRGILLQRRGGRRRPRRLRLQNVRWRAPLLGRGRVAGPGRRDRSGTRPPCRPGSAAPTPRPARSARAGARSAPVRSAGPGTLDRP